MNAAEVRARPVMLGSMRLVAGRGDPDASQTAPQRVFVITGEGRRKAVSRFGLLGVEEGGVVSGHGHGSGFQGGSGRVERPRAAGEAGVRMERIMVGDRARVLTLQDEYWEIAFKMPRPRSPEAVERDRRRLSEIVEELSRFGTDVGPRSPDLPPEVE